MKQLLNTISSIEVAKIVEKKHQHVMRDIRNLINQLEEEESGLSKVGQSSTDYFIPAFYTNEQNKMTPMYELTRQGCELYSTRMIGSRGTHFAAAFISKFHEMEHQLEAPATVDLVDFSEDEEEDDSAAAVLPPGGSISALEQLRLMYQATEETSTRVNETETRLTNLEENAGIDPADYQYITSRVAERVAQIGRSFGDITNGQKKLLFIDINGSIKRITGVGTRSQLKKRHYQTVVDFICD